MTAPETFTASSKQPLTTGRRPDTIAISRAGTEEEQESSEFEALATHIDCSELNIPAERCLHGHIVGFARRPSFSKAAQTLPCPLTHKPLRAT
jgi:hypothetical protein